MQQDINWQTLTDSTNDSPLTHFIQCDASEDVSIQLYIQAAIDRAIAIIPQSMHDNARYLLFTWEATSAKLTVVTTNDTKSDDAPELVEMEITSWQSSNTNNNTHAQNEKLQYWVRDYLTTCAEFLNYSLIAVFCEGDRHNTRLL